MEKPPFIFPADLKWTAVLVYDCQKDRLVEARIAKRSTWLCDDKIGGYSFPRFWPAESAAAVLSVIQSLRLASRG